MKTGWIFGIQVTNRIHKSKYLRFGFVNHKTKQIFLESGFVTTIWNESMFLQISYTIPASLNKMHEENKFFCYEESYRKQQITNTAEVRIFLRMLKVIFLLYCCLKDDFTLQDGWSFFQNLSSILWMNDYSKEQQIIFLRRMKFCNFERKLFTLLTKKAGWDMINSCKGRLLCIEKATCKWNIF